MKLKKGDKVIVIAGKERGNSGTIARVLPDESKIVIDGLNLSKRHRRRTAATKTGQIVEKPMPIHVSNVMLADPKTGKPTRIRIVRGKDGARERIATKSGQKIA